MTLIVDQDVSTPSTNTSSNIGSPSFARRSFSTQVTVNDGDTIAIGGFIQEANTHDTAGTGVASTAAWIIDTTAPSAAILRSSTSLS